MKFVQDRIIILLEKEDTDLKNYIIAIYTIFKYAKMQCIILLMLGLMSGAIIPIQTLFLKKIIDAATISMPYQIWILALVLVILFGLFKSYTQNYTNLLLKVKLSKDFSDDFLNKLNSLEYKYYENSHTYDLINRFSSPSETAVSAFNGLLLVPQHIVTLFGMGVLFINVSWLFLLGMVILFSISLFFNIKEVGNLQKFKIKHTVTDRKISYLSSLLLGRIEAKEIKLFGLGPTMISMWEKETNKMINERNNIRRKGFYNGAVAQLINFLFIFLGVSLLIYFAVNQRATMGQVMALATILPSFSLIASWYLPFSIAEMKRNGDIWSDYFKIMSLAPREMKELAIKSIDHMIRFDNVYFTYPGTENEVLKGVSFTINPNEKVALVGRNGAGKSTIIKLLLGLYRPTQGTVSIGNISVADMPDQQRSQIISAVFQDYVSYSLSVRENIAVSNIEKINDNAAIHEAAKLGLSYDFITKLPNRFDTFIGKLDDDGVELSSGQLQKLAVSRAVMSDAYFLVLDEPTASMDPKSECEMYENFIKLVKNRGCIIISHRLASARIADRIIVLNDGKIVESGIHDELMLKNGLYKMMFDKQSAWYKRKDGSEYF